MSVRIAKSAGFCFGVRRAVDEMERLLAQKSSEQNSSDQNNSEQLLFTLGPIIHNPQIIEEVS